jgi:hypothetical protein
MNGLLDCGALKYVILNGLRLNMSNQTGYVVFSLPNGKAPAIAGAFSMLNSSIAVAA